MSRITLLSLLLFALAVLPAAAQDATPDAPRTRAALEAHYGWTCPDRLAGGTLGIFNWTNYMPDALLEAFQTLCDVTIRYDTFDSNAALLGRLRLGNPGFDLMMLSHFLLPLVRDEALAQPLDHALIPNLAALADEFRAMPDDPGNVYGVPYLWGTLGIAYNAALVDSAPSSWDDFFGYDGPVAWFEDTRAMLSIAALMLGDDPNTTDPDVIAAAADYLLANGANAVAFHPNNSLPLMLPGDVHMALENNGNVYQMRVLCECDDFQYVIPDEGSYIWTDALAIPTDAPNPALAHAFLDYLLTAQAGAELSTALVFATPNAAAQALLDPALVDDPLIYPDAATMQRLFYTSYIADPDVERLYADTWDRVKLTLAGG